MGGWTGEGKDTIIWDGTIKTKQLIAGAINADNLKADHIAEKTSGHDVVFDNTIEVQPISFTAGASKIITFDGIGSIGADAVSFLGTAFQTSTTNIFDLGTSSAKWKDLHLSGDANIGGDAVVTGTVQGEHLYSTDDLVVDDDVAVGGQLVVGMPTSSDTESARFVKSADFQRIYFETYSLANKYSLFYLRRSRTDTLGTRARTVSGDYLGNINFHGVDQTLAYDTGASILVRQTGASGSRCPSEMEFYTASTNGLNRNAIMIDDAGNIGMGTATPSVKLDVRGEIEANQKIKLTAIGGYAIKLTNETGAVSVAGETVIASTGTADAVGASGVSELQCIGIFLDDSVAEHAEAWVVVGGIADVKADGVGWALGDRLVTSGTARRAVANNNPSVAVHFQEIGHAVEGAGANALGRVVLHFL